MSWCKEALPKVYPRRAAFCRDALASANTALRTTNHLHNIKTIFDDNGVLLVGNDNTRANAFQHAYWNALIADAIDDAKWLLGFEEGPWQDTAKFWTDELYERPSLQGTLVDRRNSGMDLHNNEVGRSYMRRHFDEGSTTPTFAKPSARSHDRAVRQVPRALSGAL